MGSYPRPAGYIGDRIASGKVIVPLQALVHNSIEACRFILVAFDGIRHLAWCEAEKMMRLSRHRSEPAHLPEQPFLHLYALAFRPGIEASGFASEILQDCTGFKYRNQLAARAIGVDNGRNAVVWRDA